MPKPLRFQKPSASNSRQYDRVYADLACRRLYAVLGPERFYLNRYGWLRANEKLTSLYRLVEWLIKEGAQWDWLRLEILWASDLTHLQPLAEMHGLLTEEEVATGELQANGSGLAFDDRNLSLFPYRPAKPKKPSREEQQQQIKLC